MSLCLITGGAGNIAVQLLPWLSKAGHEVVLWDVVSKPAAVQDKQVRFIQGDLTDPDHVQSVMADIQPDVLLHFATLLSGDSETNRTQAWRVNVDSSFALFEQCIRFHTEKYLFLSSLASYGAPLPNPVPEDFPQWPVGLYGTTKAIVERLAHYYHARHGMDFRALRLPIVVSAQAPSGAASAYASRAYIEAVENGAFTYRVRPAARPVIIYIEDVLQAIVNLLDAPAQQLSRRVYNVQALSPTAEEMAQAIQDRCPAVELTFDPDPTVADLIDSWPQEIVDASAHQDWGWQPAYDLDSMSDHFLTQLKRQ